MGRWVNGSMAVVVVVGFELRVSIKEMKEKKREKSQNEGKRKAGVISARDG